MKSATRLACLSATLGLASALVMAAPTASFAQKRGAPAKPAEKPAAAQENAQSTSAEQGAQGNGPMVVQVKPEPSQAEWTKVCGKDPSGAAEICYTTRDFVSDQGQPVLATAVYDVKGQQNARVVRFLLPLGLLLKPGIRLTVDQNSALSGSYTVCFPNGCFAETVPLNEQTIAQMKKGNNLNVMVQNQVGRMVTFEVPLAGFTKAFDGPPIDPKVLAEQQKRLQDELEKRSEELRKKLEQSSAAGGTAPAAAAKK